jgi:S-DNA-T family DNA segregation ATPase FtsK/SpoIIIE
MLYLYLILAGLLFGLAAFLRVHRFAWAIACRDWATCRSLGRLLVILATWRTLARQLDLVTRDRTPEHSRVLDSKQAGKSRRSIRTPMIFPTADRYGVKVTLRTTPGVGLVEVQDAARHLADAWRSVRVAVTQPRPGWLHIRAVRLDPLTEVTELDAVPGPLNDLALIPIGVDEYAEPVALRLKGISGIGVYGLPGYGKTSLINGVICRLAALPVVHFIVFDGKLDEPLQGDYGDVADRLLYLGGDDLEEANRVLGLLVEHRKDRARRIRAELGVKDIWKAPAGFTPEWPLLLVIIDEAHTYFSQVKDGGDRDRKARNAKAAQNVDYVEDLVKKGRAVGIITVVATQKGTGDAIPTMIRDVCTVSLCFAVKTIESAVAALGEDIREWPDVSPVALQDPVYIGVATMKVIGRAGFTRVRMPWVPDEIVAAAIAQAPPLPTPRRGLASLPELEAIEA